MKSITHENRRRLTIITLVSILIVAIATTTLILLLKKNPPAPTNTIEVGRRIDTSLAGNRTIAGASVWNGTSSTKWTSGSGTASNPYLIKSAANLAYLRDTCNNGTHYKGVYFKQTVDIDLNCTSSRTWAPIGSRYTSSTNLTYFEGEYDGNNLSIINVQASSTSEYTGLFGWIRGGSVRNLNVYYNGPSYAADPLYDDDNPDAIYDQSIYYGGIAGSVHNNTVDNCTVNNFTVSRTIDHDYYNIYIGGLAGELESASISDCEVNNMSVVYTITNWASATVGGLAGYARYTDITDCLVSNVNISITNKESGEQFLGGIVGYLYECTVSNVVTSGLITGGGGTSYNGGTSIGGAFGLIDLYNDSASCEDIISYVDIVWNELYNVNLGGIAGGMHVYGATYNMTRCQYNGTISGSSSITTSTNNYVGGLIGGIVSSGGVIISECSFDGVIDIVNSESSSTLVESSTYIGGLVGFSSYVLEEYSRNIQYCTVNGTIKFSNYSTATQYVSGICAYQKTVNDVTSHLDFKGIIVNLSLTLTSHSKATKPTLDPYIAYYSDGVLNITKCYYNSTFYTETTTRTEALTSTQMRVKSNFSAMTEFDDYFIHVKGRNNDFPIVKSLLKYSKITGFDGDGTEANPFQIKTTADLQAMQSNYNNLDEIQEYWWILINDIDISRDANDMEINWCPIAYEEGVATGFNGHFLGNNKTITGLTITEQYENVGLFGRLAPNATITNLTVSGTINWDQAKYVGGVVGLMEEGSTLTNCRFEGTITGYLNSGNYATVEGLAGSYSVDAISGSANYESYMYGKNNYTTFNRYNTTYEIT